MDFWKKHKAFMCFVAPGPPSLTIPNPVTNSVMRLSPSHDNTKPNQEYTSRFCKTDAFSPHLCSKLPPAVSWTEHFIYSAPSQRFVSKGSRLLLSSPRPLICLRKSQFAAIAVIWFKPWEMETAGAINTTINTVIASLWDHFVLTAAVCVVVECSKG